MSDASSDERRQRIEEYTSLVRIIASQTARRLPSHVELDDLISAGTLGLIDAVDKFDRAVATNFKKYAEIRIKGAILDELRALDPASRTHRKQSSDLRETVRQVEADKGGKATEEEIADRLGMDLQQYHLLTDKLKPVFVMGFEDLTREGAEGGDPMSLIPDPHATDPRDLTHFKKLFHLVLEAIDTLPERERSAMRLHFFEDMTLKEAGRVMDVTESRVSQLVTKAVGTLQKRMANRMRGDQVQTSQID
ncbi:MAG: FliA/WhiG family RNA polymerase sigma factor [Myxococcota bacterium]|nr:FliA/WhiG family RNA polymerase sigma factor [Myxococcota bacterium]MEE2779344.1 FliA/WhiG family RNA polymerase sigma factor [Myxococcota bacterium]